MKKGKYDHLKGKDLVCYDVEGRKVKCFVANIDFDKGITIKYLNPKDALFGTDGNYMCMNKKEENKKHYQSDFNWVVKQIERGGWKANDDPDEKRGAGSSQLTCAFE